MSNSLPQQSIAANQPDENDSVHDWVNWFWCSFLPGWIERARDPNGFGFFDLLDANGQPAQQDRRTALAQARLLFTFSHLALQTKHEIYHNAARVARETLPLFRKQTGGYCRARSDSRQATGDTDDDLAYSYDQSFVILGLVTWARLNGNSGESELVESEIEACWSAIDTRLTDPATGLLLEHDGLANPADPTAPPRAQNPHMHLYEASLQAFEMTGHQRWLERARQMREKGLEYFFDKTSGTITEFLTPDLSPLAGRDGQRREIGHQCEWAWLLCREAELGGDKSVKDIAEKLLAFADTYGFASSGAMEGAAFDAVSFDTSWRENRFLLWPQTEAIKTYAIRNADPRHANKAKTLALLIFQKYFSHRAAFINQLDDKARPVWPDALSRLHYHLVLALTEGARAGLWQKPV